MSRPKRSYDKLPVKVLQYTVALIFLWLTFIGIKHDRSDLLVMFFASIAAISLSPKAAKFIDEALDRVPLLNPTPNKPDDDSK